MVGLLWGLAVILFIVWVVCFLAFHITSGLIHILLILAVIVLIYNLITGARGRRTL